jgi:uncharacterized protein YebE (UPF0316 family)
MTEFLESGLFRWALLPLMIFIARILDVSIQTIRIIFISRGHKIIAPVLGFFEVLIWLLAISQIIKNLSNPICYLAYGGGFAAGTYIGLLIEEKLAIGTYLVRIITRIDASPLVTALRDASYGVTNIPAEGADGKVCIIYTVVRRVSVPEVLAIIERHNPGAFYTIENVRSVSAGTFPEQAPGRLDALPRRWRKGK